MSKPRLNAEWISYMKAYRLYDAKHPYNTVAYVDSIEDAEAQHPEYDYFIIDSDTMGIEMYDDNM